MVALRLPRRLRLLAMTHKATLLVIARAIYRPWQSIFKIRAKPHQLFTIHFSIFSIHYIKFGSSYTGAPSRRALRREFDRRIVGHDHRACRPRSGRRRRQASLYKFGGSEISTASVRTDFAMTSGVACRVIARLAEQAVAALPLAAFPPYGCGVPLAGAIYIKIRAQRAHLEHFACRRQIQQGFSLLYCGQQCCEKAI